MSMNNILQVSDKELKYSLDENIKIISLTNLTANTGVSRPIMFKVKTNKVDLVDAKPSCGYISSKANANTIKISIRVPKKEPFTAKVQILYVIYGQVTQQIVSANRQHLNLTQYNEFYQKIKKNNFQVKNHIIQIIKTNEIHSGNNKSLNSQQEEQIQDYLKQNKPSTSNSRQFQYQKLSQIRDETSAQQKQIKKQRSLALLQKEKEKKSIYFSVASNKDSKSSIQFSLSSNKNPQNIQMTKGKLITFLVGALLLGFLLGYFLRFSSSSSSDTLGIQQPVMREQKVQKQAQIDSIDAEILQKQDLKSGKNEANERPRLVQTQNSERVQEFGQKIIDGQDQNQVDTQEIQQYEHLSQKQNL